MGFIMTTDWKYHPLKDNRGSDKPRSLQVSAKADLRPKAPSEGLQSIANGLVGVYGLYLICL